MKKYFAFVLLVVAGVSLAACDPGSVPVYKEPPHVRDKQIICTLTGDSYIYISDDYSSSHTVRSPETDPLCAALKQTAKPVAASGASQ
jgi:hypothetical protein